MLTRLYNVDYGYDAKGECGDECKEIKRKYKCTRGVDAPSDEVERHMRDHELLKCRKEICLPFDAKYYEWYTQEPSAAAAAAAAAAPSTRGAKKHRAVGPQRGPRSRG